MVGIKVLTELKTRYGLSEKHMLVLKTLRNKDLPAKRISSKTDISLGRLYEYLNDLLSYGLIEKKGKKPSVYSTEKMDEKVRNFLRIRFDKTVRDEKALMDLLRKRDMKDYVEVTKTKEDFIYTQLKMLGSCRKLYTITRFGSIPFLLYPSSNEKFVAFRKAVVKARPNLAGSSYETVVMINKAYAEAYRENKKMVAIVCRESFDFHMSLARKELGEDFYQSMIDELKKRMKDYSVKIYLIDEFNPAQIFINDDTVYVSIVHGGSTFGTIIHSMDATDIYNHVFEGMVERGIPLRDYLKGVAN